MQRTTPPVDVQSRWSDLTVEELRELARLNRENPDGAIECDPSLWPDQVDDDVWAITDDGDPALDVPPADAEPAAPYSVADLAWEAATSIDRDDQPSTPWVPMTVVYSDAVGPMGPAFGHHA